MSSSELISTIGNASLFLEKLLDLKTDIIRNAEGINRMGK